MNNNQPARKSPNAYLIKSIIECLSPCKIIAIKEGDVIDVKNKILVLDEGLIAVCYPDEGGAAAFKELEYVNARYIANIFTLFESQREYVNLYYCATTDCLIRLYDKDDFKQDVTQSNNWDKVAELIAINFSHLCRLYFSANSSRVYKVIRSHLINLNTPQLSKVKAEVTIVDFISKRSSLSRTSIMKTLSYLTRNSYIVAKNGRLIDIIDLPPELIT